MHKPSQLITTGRQNRVLSLISAALIIREDIGSIRVQNSNSCSPRYGSTSSQFMLVAFTSDQSLAAAVPAFHIIVCDTLKKQIRC